jgi:two-component system, NtrC family, response regulator AtoC
MMVVSDEASLLRLLGTAAHSNAWHLETSTSEWDAMERAQSGHGFDLVLLDIHSGDGRRVYLLQWLRKLYPDLAIAVIVDSDDRDSRNEAMRVGARHVLVRPLRREDVETLVLRNLRASNGHEESDIGSEDVEFLRDDEFYFTLSPVMQKVRIQAELLAHTDLPVLILGEPGSGKGMVARLIHRLSVHAASSFTQVNCSDMPADLLEIELFGKRNGSTHDLNGARSMAGKLESPENGSLLLNEVTAMPMPLQARLLQVLRKRQVAGGSDGRCLDVGYRILAASSDRVDRSVAEKRLDEGLYHALSAFTIQVPPVRQRKDEIPALLRYSMHKLARLYGLPVRHFSQQILEECASYSWPTNLREIDSLVKRYLITGDLELNSPEATCSAKRDRTCHPPRVKLAQHDEVKTKHQFDLQNTVSLRALVQSITSDAERTAIAAALEQTRWNRKAAARLLKVSYRTLLYKIERYQMSGPAHAADVYVPHGVHFHKGMKAL